MNELFAESDLVARKLDWIQGMQWFVAARPDSEDEINDLARRLRPPLTGAGAKNRKIGAGNLTREELEL